MQIRQVHRWDPTVFSKKSADSRGSPFGVLIAYHYMEIISKLLLSLIISRKRSLTYPVPGFRNNINTKISRHRPKKTP